MRSRDRMPRPHRASAAAAAPWERDAMNLKPRRHEDPEINMISLIDVVLMIVVFFVLSSQFINEGRVHVRLPQAQGVPNAKTQGEPIVVSVTQTGSYRVNDKDLINSSPDTLR